MHAKDPWMGYVAEVGLACYLTEHGIPYVFNGHDAVDSDFVVGGLSTGCKSRSVDLFKPSQLALIPDRHWTTGPDEQYFFCCWERLGARVLLLGAQAYGGIAEHAIFHALGDGPAKYEPCLSLGLRQLLSPLVWSGRMMRGASGR
jgi:hypothetical protein